MSFLYARHKYKFLLKRTVTRFGITNSFKKKKNTILKSAFSSMNCEKCLIRRLEAHESINESQKIVFSFKDKHFTRH